MRTVGLFKAKTHLSEIIKNGEEVCLTNRGEEVAIIVPVNKYRKTKIVDAFCKLQNLKNRIPLGNVEDIQEMKNVGRK